MAETESPKWICGSVLIFDDATAEGALLHRGSEEECRRAADLIAALSYNGSKQVVESRLVIRPQDEWDAMWDT